MAGVLAGIRDVAIILLALLDVVLIAILVVIAWQLRRLVMLLMARVPEVLDTVKDTATTVQGTADFVSTAVVKPVIDMVGFLAAIRGFLSILVLGRRRRRS